MTDVLIYVLFAVGSWLLRDLHWLPRLIRRKQSPAKLAEVMRQLLAQQRAANEQQLQEQQSLEKLAILLREMKAPPPATS